MRIIKKILLTEYIGAMVVAVLIADAFTSFVMTSVEQVAIHLQSTPLPPGRHLSVTYSVGGTGIRIMLYLVIAYLLVCWLYPSKQSFKNSLSVSENTAKE
jgi:hypothetical protein